MNWYLDAKAPLTAGRRLFGRTVESALSEAASLWSEGAYSAARGYIVVDTEDGTVLCRHERELLVGRTPGKFERFGGALVQNP